MATPKLGKRQELVLDALRRHGIWPGRWVYDTASGTRNTLDSLVKKGLVYTEEVNNSGFPTTYYRPVEQETE